MTDTPQDGLYHDMNYGMNGGLHVHIDSLGSGCGLRQIRLVKQAR